MRTIHELAAKYDVSPKLIRKMKRGGDLGPVGKDDLASRIRACLSKDEQLSAEQLLALINNPEILHELRNHKQRAREQVWEMGNVKANAAPPQVTACIQAAAGGEPESVAMLMRWIKSVVPPGPVRYQWIAVRLLVGRAPNLRKAEFRWAALSMKHVRAHPDFRGWWGTKRVGSQNPTIYHRPRLPFDL